MSDAMEQKTQFIPFYAVLNNYNAQNDVKWKLLYSGRDVREFKFICYMTPKKSVLV